MEAPVYQPEHPIRFVTATSLYDGHDVSINIMRRIMQDSGAEVIHLGHNRSVHEIVNAAIQEDAQGIAVSSYQGGHMEFFKFMHDLLLEKGAGHVRIFGGGGGVILPDEIKKLEEYGICKIFSPEDGRRMGLQGMINYKLKQCDFAPPHQLARDLEMLPQHDPQAVARMITAAELLVQQPDEQLQAAQQQVRELAGPVPVLGITGTGGAGKSSLTDELVRRFLRDFVDKTVAILSVDPTRKRTGGALLGDRIRMNAIDTPRVFMRSLATRDSRTELSAAINEAVDVLKAAAFDLIIVETSGIGQGNAGIVEVCDVSLYVMTSEFGAPTQLEKIDMLDFADLIALNKMEKRGAEDALRNVRKQYRRNRHLFEAADEELPVYGTIASQFNDVGVNRLYQALLDRLNDKCKLDWQSQLVVGEGNSVAQLIIPPEQVSYLSEIVHIAKAYRKQVKDQTQVGRQLYQLSGARELLAEKCDCQVADLDVLLEQTETALSEGNRKLLQKWPELKKAYRDDVMITKVRDKEIRTELTTTTLSGTRIPKVCLPDFADYGEIIRWCMKENAPGFFPYTAGLFPFKRTAEDPKRQFAGEGTPERTNRRFHYLTKDDVAKRLSTAFDSVTLYGEDPDERPDIYGKVGMSGVSICTQNDMDKLFAGFDLCDPMTSVSLTINGPAPMLLAMFMNTADRPAGRQVPRRQRPRAHRDRGREDPRLDADDRARHGAGRHPQGGPGPEHLHLLDRVRAAVMGDIQQYFIDQRYATTTRSRSAAITSPRQGPTRSASSPSPSPVLCVDTTASTPEYSGVDSHWLQRQSTLALIASWLSTPEYSGVDSQLAINARVLWR